ncbi:FeoA family protein [Desulfohalovibrio reitneri]|uniref:FeoA family protein n=1 Tax=Desulfohalovibrio reitneri TaxID=1307759 RepID=UPI0004A6C9DD|nr:FeoA family protein [Desulfohalovibrio reitneri]
MSQPLPLRYLQQNQKAKVVRVTASGEMGRRIRDMGLNPGAELTVTGRAPLYDPVALKLAGFTLTLRNNEADHIEVEPLRDGDRV